MFSNLLNGVYFLYIKEPTKLIKIIILKKIMPYSTKRISYRVEMNQISQDRAQKVEVLQRVSRIQGRIGKYFHGLNLKAQ